MLADRLGHEKVSTTLNTYSHLFPHKQQELVHSLESLQATDLPTPEPPSDNPLLEAKRYNLWKYLRLRATAQM